MLGIDDLLFISQYHALLLKKVVSGVGNAFMDLCDFDPLPALL